MKSYRLLSLVCGLVLCGSVARADANSYVGTFASSSDISYISLTLASTSDVTLQTYGFGGGTNQAGTPISPGGTDPFLAIFAGSGSGAAILTDAFSNPYGTSLDLGNYASFIGCPPAGTVSWDGADVCGDITMTLDGLAAGAYTIVLSDGDNIANAVFDNGTLGEGFSDLTGGQFCNLVDGNGVACPNTSGAYALDVITSGGTPPPPVPEPASLFLLAGGLIGVIGARRRRN